MLNLFYPTICGKLVPFSFSLQGSVSRQAATPDSKPILKDMSSSPEPVTTTLAYEHRDSPLGLSIQPGLNDPESEAATITGTLSNHMSSIPTDLTNSQNDITREGNVDNTHQEPMFKTITFNYPLVNQVTIMKQSHKTT